MKYNYVLHRVKEVSGIAMYVFAVSVMASLLQHGHILPDTTLTTAGEVLPGQATQNTAPVSNRLVIQTLYTMAAFDRKHSLLCTLFDIHLL